MKQAPVPVIVWEGVRGTSGPAAVIKAVRAGDAVAPAEAAPAA